MVMRKLNLRSLSQLIQLHQQLNSASMAAPA
jgi:hypothetical protein